MTGNRDLEQVRAGSPHGEHIERGVKVGTVAEHADRPEQASRNRSRSEGSMAGRQAPGRRLRIGLTLRPGTWARFAPPGEQAGATGAEDVPTARGAGPGSGAGRGWGWPVVHPAYRRSDRPSPPGIRVQPGGAVAGRGGLRATHTSGRCSCSSACTGSASRPAAVNWCTCPPIPPWQPSYGPRSAVSAPTGPRPLHHRTPATPATLATN